MQRLGKEHGTRGGAQARHRGAVEGAPRVCAASRVATPLRRTPRGSGHRAAPPPRPIRACRTKSTTKPPRPLPANEVSVWRCTVRCPVKRCWHRLAGATLCPNAGVQRFSRREAATLPRVVPRVSTPPSSYSGAPLSSSELNHASFEPLRGLGIPRLQCVRMRTKLTCCSTVKTIRGVRCSSRSVALRHVLEHAIRCIGPDPPRGWSSLGY